MIDFAVVVVGGGLLVNAFCIATGTMKTVDLVRVFNLAVLAVQWGLVAMRGQTVAKMLLRMRIVQADGSLPGVVRGVALRALPFAGLALLSVLIHPKLGLLMSVVTTVDHLVIFRDKRCLHDYVAGTFVVHEQ